MHPFWSVDRDAWVKAQDLNIGETLRTQNGTTTLSQRQTLENKTIVYNLEIYRDHNYLVSKDRLLVHNTCPNGHSVYFRHDGDGNNNYVGKADGGDLNKRYGSNSGLAENQVTGIPDNDTALGVEQHLIDLNGGAQKSGGTLKNINRAVREVKGNGKAAQKAGGRMSKGESFLNQNYPNWRTDFKF